MWDSRGHREIQRPPCIISSAITGFVFVGRAWELMHINFCLFSLLAFHLFIAVIILSVALSFTLFLYFLTGPILWKKIFKASFKEKESNKIKYSTNNFSLFIYSESSIFVS